MTKTTLAPITLTLWLDGRVSPKARPRVSNGHAYLPSAYRKWKHDAVLELLCQLGSRDCLPIAVPVAVEIALMGSSHRGDLDNLAGAVLDALVEASVLTDDRLSCVPRLVVTHTLTASVAHLLRLLNLYLRRQNHELKRQISRIDGSSYNVSQDKS